MKVRNLTPFPCGAKVTSRHPPQPEICFVVRGRFDLVPGGVVTPTTGDIEGDPLAQGFLTGDTFAEGDEELTGACLYGSDFADFKLNAEVLQRGRCYSPRGALVERLGVRIEVGPWSKTLQVTGPRRWSSRLPLANATTPEPFTELPLDYAHAFGGPGYELNPAGMGFEGDELPNVESMGEPLTRRSAPPTAPAGFGPLNPRWPQRSGKVGKAYGGDYAKRRAPFYASDFDWAWFHAAPADQQLQGYLRGDERVTLHHLHPTHAVLATELPALRLRVFLQDDAGAIRELPMRLDTLLVDSDTHQLLLTWRGLGEVREDDLSDVAFVVVGAEPLADAPLPAAHYHTLLAELVRDPDGMQALTADLKAQQEAGLARLAASEQALAALGTGGEDATGTEVANLLDVVSSPDAARREQIVTPIASALAARRQHAPDAPATPLAPPAANKTRPSPPPLVMPTRGGALPVPAGAADAVARARAETKKAEDEANAALAEAGKPPLEPSVSARLDDMLAHPRFAGLEPRPHVEPGPERDLSRQDWRERDLRGADLTSANLSETILTGADLRDARLAYANLSSAVLYQADLRGADLSGTNLTLANFTEAQAAGANLRGARCDRTFFDDAHFEGADMSGLTGEYLVIRRADLRDANLAGCRLHQAFFEACQLERADFRQATLTRCLLMGCRLDAARFDDAHLDKTSFGQSQLSHASFVGAAGAGAIFMGAQLAHCDFSFSVLPAAHFDRATAQRARFFGANLKDGRFYRAVLNHADFTRANLFGADLRKTKLDHAKLVGANLFEAVLLAASGRNADFRDANLTRCTLPVPAGGGPDA